MSRQQSGLACEECRRRKARCDRMRPQCGICVETGRTCIVVSKRSPRGPKKGQLKDLWSRVSKSDLFSAMLEQRLTDNGVSEVDLSLESNEANPERDTSEELGLYEDIVMGMNTETLQMSDITPSEIPPGLDWPFGLNDGGGKEWPGLGDVGVVPNMSNMTLPITAISTSHTAMSISGCDGELEMSDLTQADLDLLYFERVHSIAPMIHKQRYFAWASDPSVSPARCCLRSAMRTVAAAMSSQFCMFTDALYARTRRLLEAPSVGDTGLPWMTRTRDPHGLVEHERIQAWLLLSYCEFLRKPEQQAHLTAERTLRLLQLSRLADLDVHDGNGSAIGHSTSCSPKFSPVPQLLADEAWVETEEKRRTLWAAFVLDRLASMLNDRPVMLHEEIICTRLPMPEEDFQTGHQPTRMGFLLETMSNAEDCASLPSFAKCVILANLFGRCVAHRRLAQSVPLCASETESKDFWMRHESLAAVAAVITQARPISPVNNVGVSSTPKCDPMDAFNRILTCNAYISLSETAEEKPRRTIEDQMQALKYKQLAYQVALDAVALIQNAPRIAFLKNHPFLPNAISLLVKFLNATAPHPTSTDQMEYGGVNSLLVALGYLSDVNNLAREVLLKLNVDLGA
ncbi:hypothetical protein N7457_002103, partial [Penicillium paradoxum]|uniref:uncharacterized protein n=1 Tax=Penicillium paradoxum TaxID=176176 RepID=UPI00254893E6